MLSFSNNFVFPIWTPKRDYQCWERTENNEFLNPRIVEYRTPFPIPPIQGGKNRPVESIPPYCTLHIMMMATKRGSSPLRKIELDIEGTRHLNSDSYFTSKRFLPQTKAPSHFVLPLKAESEKNDLDAETQT